jgi:hypothetical protein
MSFNIRYINKDNILSQLNNLETLFSSDSLILDDWSSNFHNNYKTDPILIEMVKNLDKDGISNYNFK